MSAVDDPLELLALSDRRGGRFTGRCIDGVVGRVFGGHTLAHAIRIGDLATGSRRDVAAVHCHFVAPAQSAIPVEYDSKAIKRGRALDVVTVTARQRSLVTFHAFLNTQAHEPSPEYADAMPDAPAPELLETNPRAPHDTNPMVRAPFDLKYITEPRAHPAREDIWFRTHNTVASDAPNDHAALLAYAVDFMVSRSAHHGLPKSMAATGASLDHAMWFHRPFRVDDWLFVRSEASNFASSRSLATSQVFDRHGRLVATASQSALIRAAQPSLSGLL